MKQVFYQLGYGANLGVDTPLNNAVKANLILEYLLKQNTQILVFCFIPGAIHGNIILQVSIPENCTVFLLVSVTHFFHLIN